MLGQIHFWVFFVRVNLTFFFPMHFLGVARMPRRIPDYPDVFITFNKLVSRGSYILAISFCFWEFFNVYKKRI
jgi:heme/copper-type cytochrome/quinol oxidase subunit 1